MIPTDVMTIREMCEAYDVTPRTLRFYEAKELLTPIRDRDQAAVHPARPGAADADPARQALRLQPGGYPPDAGPLRPRQVGRRTAPAGLRARRAERLAVMEAQRAELDVAIADLKAELADATAKG